MSMGKQELIQRVLVRVREAKQTASQKLEDDMNILIKWLGEEEVRIAKENLTNGTVTLKVANGESVPVAVEETTKGVPDRE